MTTMTTKQKIPVVLAHGDGIGPEIMEATLSILNAAKVPLIYHTIEVGERIYKQGVPSGIPDSAWDLLRQHRVLLKAPITTPQGGGVKSLNVTLRKTLGLFANVRPCSSYFPYVATKHPKLDVVIVRENEEDLYSGVEHRQTPQVTQCLKIITRPGCERIIRYAFEYAVSNGRKKVSCFTKDNIMKITDGLFHRVFDEVRVEYPEIETDHWILDIGTARLAETPEIFDVIVTLNLYGDVISDVAAQLTGSVGLGGSANIGQTFSMFEAIHGSAPMIAGQQIANPSGILISSVMMLNHLGLSHEAQTIHNAWLKTIEDGVHTVDIFKRETSKQKVSTGEFANAVIQRLGEVPKGLPVQHYATETAAPTRKISMQACAPRKPKIVEKRELVGVDVFAFWEGEVEALASSLLKADHPQLQLKVITNRGLKMWPNPSPEAFFCDHWRCRFLVKKDGDTIKNDQIVDLLSRINAHGVDFIKMEQLYTYNGIPGFSLSQGE